MQLSKSLMKPRIFVSPDSDGWPALAAEVIGRSIRECISSRDVCNLMLTGGNTAKHLYNYWSKTSELPLDKIRFLFGDERCVPPHHADSNYALVMKTLLAQGMPRGCTVERMEADRIDREAAARAYEKLLTEAVDVLLLSMGIDGHVASLFPHSIAFCSDQRRVVQVTGPTSPCERLTITPQVIAQARSVFVLVAGKEKGRVVAEALKTSEDFVSLPIRLTMGGTWLLDTEAGSQL